MVAERLRKAVLQAAMEGKLTEQQNEDSSVNILIDAKYMLDNIDNDLPWEIPENWSWVKFSNLVSFNMGKTPDRSNYSYWGKDIPWISIADMNNQEVLSITKEKVSNLGFDKFFSSKIVPKGTLIMSFKLTVGRTSILDINALHNEAIISIYPNKEPDIQKSYLFYILPIMANLGDAKDAIKGRTLNKTSISNLLIPLPPIEEQKRIVEKVEELFLEIESLEKYELQLNDLEKQFPIEIKNSIIEYFISGKFLNQNNQISKYLNNQSDSKELIKKDVITKDAYFDIPNNWLWIKLKDLGKMGMGQTLLKKDMIDKGEPIYSATIEHKPLGYIQGEENKLKLTYGDFVIPARGASIGHVKLINEMSVTCTQTTIYFKTNYKELSKYLYYCFLGLNNKIFIRTGSAQPQITVGVTEEQLIPIPPAEARDVIVSKLDKLFNSKLLKI